MNVQPRNVRGFRAGAAELTVVGLDMETYGACWVKPAIEADGVGSVRLFGPHGRLDCHPQNSSLPLPTPIMSLDAKDIWISTPMDLPITRPVARNPDIELGRSVESYVRVDRGTDAPWRTQVDGAGAPFRLRISSNNTATLGNDTRSGGGGGGALPAAAQAALLKMVASPAGGTWAVAPKPSALPPLPPSPAASGHGGGVGARDDTARLQAMIDSWVTSPDVPQVVPAGVYYIAGTLRVGRLPDAGGNTTACLAQKGVRMLVGAGEESVIIMATDPSMTMVTSDGCWPNGGGNATGWRSENSRFHVSGVTLAGGAVGLHMSGATGHLQITDSMLSHVRFRELSKYGIWLDDVYGLDNNLFSFLTFDGCGVAFYQRAPDSQRVSPGGACKPAWNNPSLGYMDKVVFYRVQVTNCRAGFQLDACRADNLNYWVENSVANVSGSGWDLHANSEAAIVSSYVDNVGEMNGGSSKGGEGGGSAVCVINSRLITGPNTKYLLASDAKVEGSSFEVGKGASPTASLFQPPPKPFQNWPSVEMSRSRVSKGLPMPKLLRESVLFNNRFEEPADSGGGGGSRDLNKAAVAVNGSTITALAGAPSELAPTSGLCFGPGW